MPRRQNNHGAALRQERQAEKLRVRSDQLARRSARALGAIIGLERMTGIRRAIASRALPDTIRPIAARDSDRQAYAVDLGAVCVVALYDPRSGSVTGFEAFGTD